MKRWGEGRMGGSRSNRVEDESHFSQVARARCPQPPHAHPATQHPLTTLVISKLLLLQRVMQDEFRFPNFKTWPAPLWIPELKSIYLNVRPRIAKTTWLCGFTPYFFALQHILICSLISIQCKSVFSFRWVQMDHKSVTIPEIRWSPQGRCQAETIKWALWCLAGPTSPKRYKRSSDLDCEPAQGQSRSNSTKHWKKHTISSCLRGNKNKVDYILSKEKLN